MKSTDILIIGGGPAGLGAAVCAQENGLDWHMFEKEGQWGGLSASFKDEKGFTWDLGGHILFSHYGNFDRQMEKALSPAEWISHERESWIRMRNRFIPYPFQNNLHRLDPDERSLCLEGLDMARKNMANRVGQACAKPANFEEWIVATFGPGISDLFMNPYNLKVWAHPLSSMDYSWVGERVAVPSMEEILKSISSGKDNLSWGPNKVFRFPLKGGTGAIWDAVAEGLSDERRSICCEVVSIDRGQRTVMAASGEKWSYRNCISTMPLDRLIRVSGDNKNPAATEKLASSSAYIIGVGIEGCPPDHLKTKCWMYFPEKNSPYYRVTVFSNYSPNNVARPGEQWSLMAEISESKFKKVDGTTVVNETLRAMEEDGLLPDRRKIVSVVNRRIPESYPVPFLGRDVLIDPILQRFEESGIFSRGRFGAWKYEVGNQDHSYQQGYECVQRLLVEGGPECEPTLHNPNLVNSRKNG
ncbi:MAG: NAD(P)-binding protein [Kiritimatiellae bacterium]|nr:NAD(P)-binding protein [Kiritimatiellia bacterium]MDD5521707.1 NAD(P)-binding protein [Kiritimatiellia bacterium]